MYPSPPSSKEVLLRAELYYSLYDSQESWMERSIHTFELAGIDEVRERWSYDIDFSFVREILSADDSLGRQLCLPLSVVRRRYFNEVDVEAPWGGKLSLAPREESAKILLYVLLGWVVSQGYSIEYILDSTISWLYNCLYDQNADSSRGERAFQFETFDLEYSNAIISMASLGYIISVADLRTVATFDQMLDFFRANYISVAVLSDEPSVDRGRLEVAVRYNAEQRLSARKYLLKMLPIPAVFTVSLPIALNGYREHLRVISPSTVRMLSCSVEWEPSSFEGGDSRAGDAEVARFNLKVGKGNDGIPSYELGGLKTIKMFNSPACSSVNRWNLASSHEYSSESAGGEDCVLPEAVLNPGYFAIARPLLPASSVPKVVQIEMVTRRRLFVAPALFLSFFSMVTTFVLLVLPMAFNRLDAVMEEGEWLLAVVAVVPPIVVGLVQLQLEDDIMTVNLAFSRILLAVASFSLFIYMPIMVNFGVGVTGVKVVFGVQTIAFLHFLLQLFYAWFHASYYDSEKRLLAYVGGVIFCGLIFFALSRIDTLVPASVDGVNGMLRDFVSILP